MKTLKVNLILSLGLFLLMSITAGNGDGAFDAAVNTLKQDCKDLIEGTRYEGSKITYFNGGTKQTKSVELFMFLPNEYKIAIGCKKAVSSVTVRIYDAPADVSDRTLVKEYKKMQGKNFTISTIDLNTAYRKKVPEVEHLKNVHIEYSIGAGKSGKEAIVLVYGHKA